MLAKSYIENNFKQIEKKNTENMSDEDVLGYFFSNSLNQ